MTADSTDVDPAELDHRVIQVPEGLEGERVDSALARLLGLSRTRASELVADGHVTLDGHAPAKSDRVSAGAILEASIPAPRRAVVVATEVAGMRIVFQDDDIVVVDKPVGVAAHPSVGWSGPTVLDHLAGVGIRISTSGAPERRGIVHRLDVGTSGLMTVAKSEHAYTVLKQAFRDRTVEKTYHALVQGHPDPHTGTIDAPIARHPKHDFKFTVKEGGRYTITHYDTQQAHRFASLLTIKLETGRTHQIRVHMSAIHHPCVGDLMYGADPTLAKRVDLARQWLHAKGLAFTHPRTGEWVEFSSDYPDDLVHALTIVRTIDDNPLPR
ncbi:MAG: pseudouridine synthase [Aeromicrobium sp.]|nr:pseudouridine synthase [Aeromicrobium sp.]